MPASSPHPLAGEPAPAFEGESTLGRDVGVPGDERTRVTVVDFWAPFCAACQVTIPALGELYDDYRREGVMVIGVAVDESEEAAQRTATRLGGRFPIVMDGGGRIAGSYRVHQVPLTFVLDREGRVRWVGREMGEARRAVRFLLRER